MGRVRSRAIFMNILEFRARVFVMSGGHSDYPRAALSPETTLPVRRRRPRAMRVPAAPRSPRGRWVRWSAVGDQAAASTDGHLSQAADRLAFMRARRAATAPAIRSSGAASPVLKVRLVGRLS